MCIMQYHGDYIHRYSWFFWFLFSFVKENHVFNEEEHNPSKRLVTIEEELDSIDTDNTGNLEDLQRLVFIDEELES